ncbi:MAG: efflux transporter outer membrane subunit [Gammaproteobacteria bacterium]|nr:efflux transporter outer membrane subunit [Gammaproteobacteria bacterium]
MMKSRICKALLIVTTSLVTSLILQGCTAVGPDYHAPDIKTPATWTKKISQQVAQGPQSSLQSWWKVFKDPMLDELIELSRQENLDLKVAISRIRESRVIFAMAKGEKQPLANAAAAASLIKLSDDGLLEQVSPPEGFESQPMLQLGVDALWEIDVFGRVRRTIEAAGASYQASVEDYRDVLVTLFAEVALSYVDVRFVQQQIVYAKANADAQRESFVLAQGRYETGVSSKLDVVQAMANLAATEASIPALVISLNQALNRLAVLIGQDAGSLQDKFSEAVPTPAPLELIGIGVPAEVLRQRPDIRRAERLLAAQTAQIGVATAELYPRFGLSGFFGLQSRSLGNLFDSSSVTWGLGAPVHWNIFSGGRVRGNIQVQNEKAQQLLLEYKHKVLLAIEEVENAIIAYDLNQVRVKHLREAASATKEAVELVLVQYNTGLTDFNNVLVTQRDLLFQQEQLLATEAQVVVNLIALYKSLGGGWDIDQVIDLSKVTSD